MAYTTPATFVAGNVLTASQLNTHLRDNIAWIATDSPSCRVYKSSSQAITTATVTAITHDSERFDNAAMHDTGSNTSRITVPSGGGGKYLTGAGVDWAGDTGGTYRNVALRLNGTTTIASDMRAPTATSGFAQASLATVYSLAAADYTELVVLHDKGSNLNVSTTANWSPEFWAFWYRT